MFELGPARLRGAAPSRVRSDPPSIHRSTASELRPSRWDWRVWTHRNRLVLPLAISAVWGQTAIPAGQGPWVSLRLEVLVWTCQLEYLGWLR